MAPRNQEDIARLHDICEHVANLLVFSVIWFPSHERCFPPDASLSPVRYGRVVEADIRRHNPKTPFNHILAHHGASAGIV